MSPQRWRLALLLLFLAVLLAVAGWRYVRPGGLASAGEPLPRSAPGQRPGEAAVEQLAGEVAELDLAALRGRPDKYDPGRDPWKFVIAPPPPPPGPTPEELERMRQEAARRAAEREAQQEVEDQTPKPPPVDLDFLGSFGPPERKIAVFSNDGAIYNALIGDVLEGKFVVASIGYESVDLKYVGFPELPAKRLAVGK